MKHPFFATIFADRPQDYPYALEERFQRILNRIEDLWGRPELSSYFEDLMIDKRGDRKGFPAEVAADVFRLYSIYEGMLRKGEIADPWAAERAAQNIAGEFAARDFGKAIEGNDVKRLTVFLDGGMPVNVRLANGWTPLMVATFNSCEEAALLLIERGATVTVTDADDYTPLHWAAFNGFRKAVPRLIEKGAHVNADNRWGWTPLLQAASRGHVVVARCLIDHGAWVNHQDREGWTALHKAVSNGHLEVALLLRARGANPGLAHKSGVTAADIARQSKRLAIRQLFSDEADDNDKDATSG